ncbi:hypothetical protein CVCC1112_3841 [Paenarthrobacter nicotinovorans]|nr:hypothetical protein ANMWB30_02050 [Arthrobacter sp. MWB30]GAT89182.1 hypothetical protein CVCC1112_3841 [Paenarthrobacter nicotinovorans]
MAKFPAPPGRLCGHSVRDRELQCSAGFSEPAGNLRPWP